MPAIFRLVNHALAGQGSLNPKAKSISNLALQDLTLAKASSLGNKTVSRERSLFRFLNPKPFRSHHTLLKEAKKKNG